MVERVSGEISFFSSDPSLNPLLDIGFRSGAPTWWAGVLAVIWMGALAYASFCDQWRGRHTPNWITHAGIVVAAALAPALFANWATHLVIAALVALVFGAAWLVGGVGMGDVKLYVGFALALGPAGIAVIGLAHVLAAIVMAPVALVLRTRKLVAPMFPFATAGLIITLAALGLGTVWIALGGLALAGALLAGLVERILGRTDKAMVAIASGLAAGADEVRLRPGSRALIRQERGTWSEAAAGPRVSAGQIDLLVDRLVPGTRSTELERIGELTVRRPEMAPALQLTISEAGGHYLITAERAPTGWEALRLWIAEPAQIGGGDAGARTTAGPADAAAATSAVASI